MKKKLIAGREPQRFSPWLKRLLIMKMLVILLLVVGLTSSYAESDAQTTKVNLKLKSATVKDVIEEIERQTDLSFMYDNNVFKVDRPVSINVENATVKSVVEKLISGENLKYEMVNRYIVITAKNTPSAFSQQQKNISGKVTDSSGTSLPGVSVVVKGTTNGTITDGNGNYSLPNIPENAIVQFSFIGMTGQEVAVGNRTTVNVLMEEETFGIEEVVAVGYGVQKRTDVTGSIISIKPEELSGMPQTSIVQSLQGKVAGMSVINTGSGADPEGNTKLRIRAQNSISADAAPFIVLDGIPYSGFLSEINPNDIESIEIL
ncbi:MAG: carboxypeptidase-like regulatory domain-containing protein, partial [Bacteroidota bacterium]|nr:carboxypeptidase-like regulatory domain-containing protein [Bacteroidota bacterium]